MAFAYTEKVAIPQPPVMEEIILLQLTKDEAETLLLVSRKIGGHPPVGEVIWITSYKP